uniref:HORMA domain-containing protein 1-like n=1 Tax=Myxine glutinosa TaxID=7769 RepID=UPI00358E69EF
MVTLQKMQTSEKQTTSTWPSIFPNDVATNQQSLLFVKRMTAIALSNITYLRGVFPEHAYSTRYFEDLSIKILREDVRFPGAGHVVNWMKGCFDALEKKYLRMMVLLAYANPDDPNTVVESYSFKYFYTENGHTMDISSSNKKLEITLEETKRSACTLIRKLFVLMQHLGTLPQNVSLSMKLFYYDEVTPEDYQPHGFKESNSDPILFDGDPVSLRIGSVSTMFHVLKLKVTTDHDKMDHDEDSEHSPLMVEDGNKESPISLNPKDDKVKQTSKKRLLHDKKIIMSHRKGMVTRRMRKSNETGEIFEFPISSSQDDGPPLKRFKKSEPKANYADSPLV